MRQILLLRRARVDLIDIQTYTHKNWGSKKVLETQSLINSSIKLIAESPFAGRNTHKNSVYIKVLPRLPFVVVYKFDDVSVSIIKIIHSKRKR